jgi:hypothetical protein
MSRINELKKQNPQWSKNIIDYIDLILEETKPKYVELFINLLKNHHKNFSNENNIWKDDLREFGVSESIVNSIPELELGVFARLVLNYIPRHEYDTYKSFINLYEKNLIEKKDITSIKSFNEVSQLVSLAEIKSWEKECENQTIVHLDNPETGWLIIRPLTFESSKKYGSSTKWCTTQKDNPEYFYRYYKNILVYCINRKTGYRVAMYHVIYENETSFWDSADTRVDSLFTELDTECRMVLVDLVKEGKSNYSLTPDEFKRLDKFELNDSPHIDIPTFEGGRVITEEDELVVSAITTGEILTNGNNVISLFPPNGIRAYERPANVNITYDLDTILPQMDISDWVKEISSNMDSQNNG